MINATTEALELLEKLKGRLLMDEYGQIARIDDWKIETVLHKQGLFKKKTVAVREVTEITIANGDNVNSSFCRVYTGLALYNFYDNLLAMRKRYVRAIDHMRAFGYDVKKIVP